MSTIKAQKHGNSMMVTIPSALGVVSGRIANYGPSSSPMGRLAGMFR